MNNPLDFLNQPRHFQQLSLVSQHPPWGQAFGETSLWLGGHLPPEAEEIFSEGFFSPGKEKIFLSPLVRGSLFLWGVPVEKFPTLTLVHRDYSFYSRIYFSRAYRDLRLNHGPGISPEREIPGDFSKIPRSVNSVTPSVTKKNPCTIFDENTARRKIQENKELLRLFNSTYPGVEDPPGE